MDMPKLPAGLDGKKVAIIAVAGVGIGLIWKHFSNKTAAASNTLDPNAYALTDNSTGNLATGSGSNGGIVDDSTTRDTGSINLPVVGWVVTIAGIQYWTADGTNFTVVNGTNPGPTTTTPGSPIFDIPVKPSQGIPRYGPTGPFIPQYNADVTDASVPVSSVPPIDFGGRSSKLRETLN